MVPVGKIIEKVEWVRKETLKLHGVAPETRIASSLSCIEILSTLFYGKVLDFDPKDPNWDGRDRFVVSKGHGSISFYPILADLGFIAGGELKAPFGVDSKLKVIPDTYIDGYETINGSLGHGIGVAAGIAIALKRKNKSQKVFVLAGDGELYEGSMWEAIMLAGHHKLDNLVVIVDQNKACMLDYCKNIIDINPLAQKFANFGWEAHEVNGHRVEDLYELFRSVKRQSAGRPVAIIADTVKGKGVSRLECDPLCHIRSLSMQEVRDHTGE